MMAMELTLRDERIERVVSESVAASYATKGMDRQNWPKYKTTRKVNRLDPAAFSRRL